MSLFNLSLLICLNAKCGFTLLIHYNVRCFVLLACDLVTLVVADLKNALLTCCELHRFILLAGALGTQISLHTCFVIMLDL